MLQGAVMQKPVSPFTPAQRREKLDAVLASLQRFYRRGRKCFVPLTPDKCKGIEISVQRLLKANLIEIEKADNPVIYRVTAKGMDFLSRHVPGVIKIRAE